MVLGHTSVVHLRSLQPGSGLLQQFKKSEWMSMKIHQGEDLQVFQRHFTIIDYVCASFLRFKYFWRHSFSPTMEFWGQNPFHQLWREHLRFKIAVALLHPDQTVVIMS
ncbi:uncharacterized protein LOC130772087 isoform X1 [Actinidia eriantha]|uniref:uncharacterized protein LOC130772087 isoform X1 n=1 Tax=Actinidia eriantha TaxID=165200 RepID=UPI0025873AB2|nr:uncharacterized protein LOC130772087 isoform X1 [Actinidia eriantha]